MRESIMTSRTIPVDLPRLLFCALAILAGRSCFGQAIEIEDAQASLIQNTFIAAPISGVVAQVLVSEGDQVELHDPLAKLDDQQAMTELEAAKAAYEAARLEGDNDVDARYATRTLEVRQKELQQGLDMNRGIKGAVSKTEIEKLRLVVDQARLAIEQAGHQQRVARAKAIEKRAAVDISQVRLQRHSIQTTVAGSVAEVAVEPGEWVEAGKPIARLISIDPIRVECFVDGRQYGPELVGRKVEFYRLLPQGSDGKPEKITGKVTFVSQELNPVTGQARVWATMGNPDRKVRAGMHGRIVILD
jgi:macrolide-specific efflux system membrane fusion protein